MYLLKRDHPIEFSPDVYGFTFHHVSIKTFYLLKHSTDFIHSHSTMYLLKRALFSYAHMLVSNSHSTMYLLKHKADIVLSVIDVIHIPPCIY